MHFVLPDQCGTKNMDEGHGILKKIKNIMELHIEAMRISSGFGF